MILHISIPAKDPKNVAKILAQLCQGIVKPFIPLEGAYMVYANDEHGSGFEVYPENIILQPGEGPEEQSRFVEVQNPNSHSTTHCAMSTQLSKQEVEAIAARENWRCIYVRRGDRFALYELWLENRFLLEVIVPEDLAEAQKALKTT